MPSEPRDTIIVRVKRATKWAARRAAKANGITLTQYIINLVDQDAEKRKAEQPAGRETEVA